MTPFSFVLRMEYLTVLRETFTQYITFNTGGRRESVYTPVLCCLAIVLFLHQPLCEDSDKIPEDRTSTYILHLYDTNQLLIFSISLILTNPY